MKLRQSNIELCRLLSMLLVLIIHVNYATGRFPEIHILNEFPIQSITKTIVTYSTLGCVDIFVIISGWFGIKPTTKGGIKFIYQVLFISFACCLIYILLYDNELKGKDIRHVLCLKKEDYWFVKAYLFLYIIAPILNAFIENVQRKHVEYFLIVFYAIQTFSEVTNSVSFLEGGYTPLSFIGIYVFARYLNVYRPKITLWLPKYYIVLYVFLVLFLSAFALITIKITGSGGFRILTSYANPLVILTSLSFFLFFLNLNIVHSRIINSVASSCFAVYLVNCNYYFWNKYLLICKSYFFKYSGYIYILKIVFFIIIVYFASILLDQIRSYSWVLINNAYAKIKKNSR